MKASNISVLYTSDYSLFKTQEGNRPLIKNDVDKIEKKILESNLLRYHPILISKDFEVIDGQHRLEVARRNSLDIYFIVMDERSSLKTTQIVNTTGKPWTVKDFLQSYITLGYKEYIRFEEIIQKYNFLTISQLLLLCSTNQEKITAAEQFRNGELLIKREELMLKTLSDIDYYNDLSLALSKKGHFQRFIFLSNLRDLGFDHNRMKNKINDNLDIVKRIPSDAYIYADMLGELYNHRLSSRNVINFNLRKIK